MASHRSPLVRFSLSTGGASPVDAAAAAALPGPVPSISGGGAATGTAALGASTPGASGGGVTSAGSSTPDALGDGGGATPGGGVRDGGAGAGLGGPAFSLPGPATATGAVGVGWTNGALWVSPSVLHLVGIPLLVLATVAVGFCLVYLKEILVPFVVSVFFVYLLRPIVNWLTTPCSRCLLCRLVCRIPEAKQRGEGDLAAARRRAALRALDADGQRRRRSSSDELKDEGVAGGASGDAEEGARLLSAAGGGDGGGSAGDAAGGSAAQNTHQSAKGAYTEIELSRVGDDGSNRALRSGGARRSKSRRRATASGSSSTNLGGDTGRRGNVGRAATGAGGRRPHNLSRLRHVADADAPPICVCLGYRLTRMPRGLAVLIALSVAAGTLSGLVLLVADAVQTFERESLPVYRENASRVADRTLTWLHIMFGVDAASLVASVQKNVPVADLVQGALLELIDAVGNTFLILLLVLYLLFEQGSHAPDSMRGKVDDSIQRYIGIKTLISAGVGLLVYLILGPALGIRMAHLFGVLTFFLNFVPNVGPVIATALPFPIVVLDPDLATTQMLLAFILPTVVHALIGNWVEPKIFGHSLELHPVVVIVSLGFWYALWGVTGAILSIPLVASMRIVLTHIRHPYSLAVIRLLEGNLTLDDADGANSPWSSAPAAHSGVPAERSDDWAFGLQQV